MEVNNIQQLTPLTVAMYILKLQRILDTHMKCNVGPACFFRHCRFSIYTVDVCMRVRLVMFTMHAWYPGMCSSYRWPGSYKGLLWNPSHDQCDWDISDETLLSIVLRCGCSRSSDPLWFRPWIVVKVCVTFWTLYIDKIPGYICSIYTLWCVRR